MSIGIGGRCRKIAEDNDCVIYEYLAYNLNEPEFKNDTQIFDGMILIDRNCLIEPEIRKKIRRMPSGKRKIFTKTIVRDVPIYELINSGKIQIENCSHTWKCMPNGVDYIAYRLCDLIFKRYQETGAMPFSFSINF